MIQKADDDLRNIRVEDPRPTLQHFFLLMQGCEPWSDPEVRRKLHICPRSAIFSKNRFFSETQYSGFEFALVGPRRTAQTSYLFLIS